MNEVRRTAAVSAGDAVTIDFKLVPEHTRDSLAETTLATVRAFLQQPGGREALDAETAIRKERSKTDESRQNIARACN